MGLNVMTRSLGDNSHDDKTINMGDRYHFSEYFDEIVESLTP